MKRCYKSALSVLLSAVMVFSVFVPTINVYAAEKLIYSTISLVPDGEMSESGYLNEKWVDENGEEVEFESHSSQKPIPNNGTSIPSSYSSVEKGYVSGIRDQATSNSCWAFSSVAAAETSLIKQGIVAAKDVDLSEAHLVWFTHRSLSLNVDDPTFGDGTKEDNPYLKGGFWLRSTFALARGSGFALEKKYPFYGSNTTLMGDYAEESRYDSKFTLDKAYIIPPEETDKIKKSVMEYGSVMVAAYVANSYLNKGADGHAYYQNVTTATNHQMIVVGWDDDFAVSNFKSTCQPANPGAWLVKNSYGTTYGDNGYFWISYDDPSLEQFVVQDVSVKDENENIYQYDGYGYNKGIGVRDLAGNPIYDAYQANVFTAEKNEMLSAVSFYTMQDNVEYEISVYKNVTYGKDSPIADGIKSSVTASGVAEFKGYQKIKLDENIALNKGENFSVVVKLSISGGSTPVYLPYEGPSGSSDSVYVRYYSSGSGQSYFKFANSSWSESSANDKQNNVCIKAFTVPDNSLEIRTAEEFNEFAESVANGTTYEDKNINLMNDIDFEGGEIIPVGTFINPFCGNFYGNGFVLKNGVIESDDDCVGIFSTTSENALILKLGAENITVNGVFAVGILCGENSGTVKYCYTTGSVSGEESVGGLIGINMGSVVSCYSNVTASGDLYVGTLIGEDDAGEYELILSDGYSVIGNEESYDYYVMPEKSFTNGQAAWFIDNGSGVRHKIWTVRDGVTTFMKSDSEMLYQVELFSPTDISSIYLYASSEDDLKALAEAEKSGYSVEIFADSRLSIPFEGTVNANMILYVSWTQQHVCADNLDLVEAVEADCYNDGNLSYYVCSCGKFYFDENATEETDEESVFISAFNHPAESVIKTDAVEADCETDGNAEYYTCTLCGDIFADSSCTEMAGDTVIPATGHLYSDWIDVTEVSCTEDGYRYKECSSCGDKIEETTPRTGHSYSDWIDVTEVSCTEDGYRYKECSSCGDKIEETIPMTDHDYVETVTLPTDDTMGYIIKTCSVCGDAYISEYIPAEETVSAEISVVSFLSDTDEITVEFIRYGESEVSYSLTTTGNKATYNMESILTGVYTIRISKKNHVTREYENVVIKADGEYDFKICPVGDVSGDGKISLLDYTAVLKHVKKITSLKSYAFQCADVDMNGKVMISDYTRILKHVKKIANLW